MDPHWIILTPTVALNTIHFTGTGTRSSQTMLHYCHTTVVTDAIHQLFIQENTTILSLNSFTDFFLEQHQGLPLIRLQLCFRPNRQKHQMKAITGKDENSSEKTFDWLLLSKPTATSKQAPRVWYGLLVVKVTSSHFSERRPWFGFHRRVRRYLHSLTPVRYSMHASRTFFLFCFSRGEWRKVAASVFS